jgi:hypothetical protein
MRLQALATRVDTFTLFARATSKAALLLFSVALLLTGSATAARGQSALDGFDPNANGLVRVVGVQPPEGKILNGGLFNTIGGQTRNNIARLDGIDCLTSENQEKQPAPDGGNSPNLPDSASDIDDSDGCLDDLSPEISARNDQATPLFSVTGRDAVTRGTSRIVPILLFSLHSFYCLHEHIRERAPPILV